MIPILITALALLSVFAFTMLAMTMREPAARRARFALYTAIALSLAYVWQIR